MNVPDYWIKLIKEQPDEAWNPENMWSVSYTHLDVYKRQVQPHLEEAVQYIANMLGQLRYDA